MKQQFIKVEIDTEKGLRQGCIDASKITAFRESAYDCNRIIVFTDSDTFVVYMKFNEMCKNLGII